MSADKEVGLVDVKTLGTSVVSLPSVIVSVVIMTVSIIGFFDLKIDAVGGQLDDIATDVSTINVSLAEAAGERIDLRRQVAEIRQELRDLERAQDADHDLLVALRTKIGESVVEQD